MYQRVNCYKYKQFWRYYEKRFQDKVNIKLRVMISLGGWKYFDIEKLNGRQLIIDFLEEGFEYYFIGVGSN